MSWTQIAATAFGLLAAHGVELLLIRWVVLSPNRQPQASVAWILTIAFVPYLGGLLFLIFGVDRINRRRADRVDNVELLSERPGRVPEAWLADTSAWTLRGQQAAAAIERLCDTRPTIGNRTEILHDTHRTLGLIEQAIGEARHHVHLEYYIWEPDETGRRLRDAIVAKAREGVEVRFLYDSFGSFFLKRRFLQPMIDAGAAVLPFSPGQSLREKWSLNNRSHRKIVVVDGRVGFTGGMNIGDEYLGLIRRSGRWRDSHLRIEGPAVWQLQQVFREDWYYASTATEPEDLTGDCYFADLEGDPRVGRIAQIVAGGPDRTPRPFHQILFGAINEAQQRITLTTGYFIPTDSLAMALAAAAMRGVDVRILVPGHTPHLLETTVWAGRSYYDTLLAAGCTIHEFVDGTLHAKTLSVDGEWALVGSANFDNRSAVLNFEVGCVIYDAAAADELDRQYEMDLRSADPITAADRALLKPRQRFVENASRLFAPVL